MTHVRRIHGVLRVHPDDPRYLTDDSGRTILLTGSHTWTVLQDAGLGWPPPRFDHEAWLAWLARHGHRFYRLWAWEQARWMAHRLEDDLWVDPLPWARTGPGLAIDGQPRFDLTRPNPAYFGRLRARVTDAGQKGIYVAVMLFQGWSVELKPFSLSPGRDPWRGHPLHRDNNVNGIDGDPALEGHGRRTQECGLAEIEAVQRQYVASVVAAVHDLENVVYEVGNEFAATPANDAWQEWVIGVVREEEARRGAQHLAWRSVTWPPPASHAELYASAAELISVNDPARHGIGTADYCYDPPAADGRKVSLLDTDHLWGVGGDAAWVWRAFMRGHHPLFMDPWETDFVVSGPFSPDAREAMGVVRALSDRFDLAGMTVRPDLCSSRYAIRLAEGTLIAWTPRGEPFSMDLRDASGQHAIEWLHPVSGLGTLGPDVAGGSARRLEPPFHGAAVVIVTPRG
jgi:hypothetical protein